MLNFIMAAIIAVSVSCSIPSIAVNKSDFDFDNDLLCTASEPDAQKLSGSNVFVSTEEQYGTNGLSRSPVIPPLFTSTTYDSYMQVYYRGLKQNFGYNLVGSCGYVGVGMLLSYYDSYLNDNIIPERYDVEATGNTTITMDKNSPGVLHDKPTHIDIGDYDLKGDKKYSNYVYYAADKVDVSLHSRLIVLGSALKFFDWRNIDKHSYGLSVEKAETLLAHYFNRFNLNYYYTINRWSKSKVGSVESFIKNNIDAGKPVLTSVYNKYIDENGEEHIEDGHMIICYEYDSNSIYAHMGWEDRTNEDNSHRAVSDTQYNYYHDALTIDFPNMAHSHAHNYKIKTIPRTYCYCDGPVS